MKNIIDHSSHDLQIPENAKRVQRKKEIKFRHATAAIISVLIVLALAGCSFTGNSDSDSDIIILEKATLPQNAESADTGTEAQTQAESMAQAQTQAEPTTPAEVIAAAKTQNSSDFEIATEDGTVTLSGSTYTITSGGTYVVTGTLSDGQIIIDAGEEDEVELDLSGASITCSYDSPIFAKNAGSGIRLCPSYNSLSGR